MLCLYAVGSFKLVSLVSTLEAVGQCRTLFRFKPHINCPPSPAEDLRLRDGWPGGSNHTKTLTLFIATVPSRVYSGLRTLEC